MPVIATNALFEPLSNTLNTLIKAMETDMFTVAERLCSVLVQPFSVLLLCFLIYKGYRSMMYGESPLSCVPIVIKAGFFLLMLKNYSWCHEFFFRPVYDLLTGIPEFLSGTNMKSSDNNFLKPLYVLLDKVWTLIDNYSILSDFPELIGVLILFIAVSGMTLTVMILYVFTKFTFLLILSLSPFLMIAFYFDKTKQYAFGALNLALSGLIELTLTFLFLSSFVSYLSGLYKGEMDIGTIFGSLLIIIIGTTFLKKINQISQSIAAASMSGASEAASSVTSGMNVMSQAKSLSSNVQAAKFLGSGISSAGQGAASAGKAAYGHGSKAIRKGISGYKAFMNKGK